MGPRQVGKTTAAILTSNGRKSIYLDLESSEDRRKIAEPHEFLRRYEDCLVVLDEIHRIPELFAELRGIIDEGRRRGHGTGRFLLLGSASMELLRQSSETLAGRIALVELRPFDVMEVEGTNPDITNLWVRGGFPPSYLAASDRASFAWRRDFIRTYLERDIPMLGPRIPSQALENLWTMLAHNQGGLVNASQLASALMVSAQTVTRYIDLLTELLLVRRLQPFHANVAKRLVKAPKVYLRDCGLTHALLGLQDFAAISGHPVAGMSWEGLVIENLIGAAPEGTRASFYRTATGNEIDLILEVPGKGVWAIDIKRGGSASPEKGFYKACEDVSADKRFAVNGGSERFGLNETTESIGLMALTEMLVYLN